MLVIFLVGIIWGAAYIYIYKPKLQALQADRVKLEEELNRFKIDSVKIIQKKKAENRYKLLERALEDRPKNFLSSQARLKLVKDLNRIGLRTGVKLLGMKPEEVEEVDIYLKIPVKLVIEGNYKELVNYVNQLSNLDYLVRIKELRMNSQEQQNNEIKMGISVVGYALNREGGARDETTD